MTEYYTEEYFKKAVKQRKRVLAVYFTLLAIYIVFSVLCVIYYTTFPYIAYADTSSRITRLKLVHYSLTGIFIVFSCIYLGIKYKRVNRYYRLCKNIEEGIRETYIGSFIEYNEEVQDKDGVDMKSLVFLEWNKYKNEYFERKVLIFYENSFPEFEEKITYRYVTQSNVLVSYEKA